MFKLIGTPITETSVKPGFSRLLFFEVLDALNADFSTQISEDFPVTYFQLVNTILNDPEVISLGKTTCRIQGSSVKSYLLCQPVYADHDMMLILTPSTPNRSRVFIQFTTAVNRILARLFPDKSLDISLKKLSTGAIVLRGGPFGSGLFRLDLDLLMDSQVLPDETFSSISIEFEKEHLDNRILSARLVGHTLDPFDTEYLVKTGMIIFNPKRSPEFLREIKFFSQPMIAPSSFWHALDEDPSLFSSSWPGDKPYAFYSVASLLTYEFLAYQDASKVASLGLPYYKKIEGMGLGLLNASTIQKLKGYLWADHFSELACRYLVVLTTPDFRVSNLFNWLIQSDNTPLPAIYSNWNDPRFRVTDLLFKHFIDNTHFLKMKGFRRPYLLGHVVSDLRDLYAIIKPLFDVGVLPETPVFKSIYHELKWYRSILLGCISSDGKTLIPQLEARIPTSFYADLKEIDDTLTLLHQEYSLACIQKRHLDRQVCFDFRLKERVWDAWKDETDSDKDRQLALESRLRLFQEKKAFQQWQQNRPKLRLGHQLFALVDAFSKVTSTKLIPKVEVFNLVWFKKMSDGFKTSKLFFSEYSDHELFELLEVVTKLCDIPRLPSELSRIMEWRDGLVKVVEVRECYKAERDDFERLSSRFLAVISSVGVSCSGEGDMDELCFIEASFSDSPVLNFEQLKLLLSIANSLLEKSKRLNAITSECPMPYPKQGLDVPFILKIVSHSVLAYVWHAQLIGYTLPGHLKLVADLHLCLEGSLFSLGISDNELKVVERFIKSLVIKTNPAALDALEYHFSLKEGLPKKSMGHLSSSAIVMEAFVLNSMNDLARYRVFSGQFLKMKPAHGLSAIFQLETLVSKKVFQTDLYLDVLEKTTPSLDVLFAVQLSLFKPIADFHGYVKRIMSYLSAIKTPIHIESLFCKLILIGLSIQIDEDKHVQFVETCIDIIRYLNSEAFKDHNIFLHYRFLFQIINDTVQKLPMTQCADTLSWISVALSANRTAYSSILELQLYTLQTGYGPHVVSLSEPELVVTSWYQEVKTLSGNLAFTDYIREDLTDILAYSWNRFLDSFRCRLYRDTEDRLLEFEQKDLADLISQCRQIKSLGGILSLFATSLSVRADDRTCVLASQVRTQMEWVLPMLEFVAQARFIRNISEISQSAFLEYLFGFLEKISNFATGLERLRGMDKDTAPVIDPRIVEEGISGFWLALEAASQAMHTTLPGNRVMSMTVMGHFARGALTSEEYTHIERVLNFLHTPRREDNIFVKVWRDQIRAKLRDSDLDEIFKALFINLGVPTLERSFLCENLRVVSPCNSSHFKPILVLSEDVKGAVLSRFISEVAALSRSGHGLETYKKLQMLLTSYMSMLQLEFLEDASSGLEGTWRDFEGQLDKSIPESMQTILNGFSDHAVLRVIARLIYCLMSSGIYDDAAVLLRDAWYSWHPSIVKKGWDNIAEFYFEQLSLKLPVSPERSDVAESSSDEVVHLASFFKAASTYCDSRFLVKECVVIENVAASKSAEMASSGPISSLDSAVRTRINHVLDDLKERDSFIRSLSKDDKLAVISCASFCGRKNELEAVLLA